jgi:3-phenylpropionate/trans-cinnamate dioxygenase ferredoxin subunit
MADVRVCAVSDVERGARVRVAAGGVAVCVTRIDDEWYAIDDRCSHADFSLCEGDLWSDEREIECPQHGSTFSLLTGEPQSLPATQPVPVYPVRVEGDDVIVSMP